MMTAIDAMLILSQFLTCYAVVLAVVWFRAVAAHDRRTHVGQFVALMGVFVPAIALTVLVFFVGIGLGAPALIPALALLLPGAVVVGLQAELIHLAATDPWSDAVRLAAAVLLTFAFLAVG